MRNLAKGSAPEEAVEESKKEKPRHSENPWKLLDDRDLDGDQGCRHEHDGGDGKSAQDERHVLELLNSLPICVGQLGKVLEDEDEDDCTSAEDPIDRRDVNLSLDGL